MMTILEEFAHWITGGSVEGYPSGQRVVFYGTTAPEELTLEEFAEQFEQFLLKKYNIKKETEKMNGTEAFKRIREVLRDYHQLTTVKVITPSGNCIHVDEYWVRAFQVVANKASDEEFAWLRDNFTIYSGPERNEKMILRRDGKFENEFEGGFFTANANMAFEIL